MEKRVLIAVPTLGLDPDPSRWMTTFLRIVADIRKNGLSYSFIAPYRMTWWAANNYIWEAALQGEFDYILRMDDDIWGATTDAFSRLYQAGVDVIGAAYPARDFPFAICALNRVDKETNMIDAWVNRRTKPHPMVEVSGEGILPCDFIGFGMTLIKVEPFALLPRPIFNGPEVCPDDSFFAQLCKDAGIQQYVNFDVQLCHREITPLNKLFLYNAEARRLINNGSIAPGTPYSDVLIESFGADGMKDFYTIKVPARVE